MELRTADKAGIAWRMAAARHKIRAEDVQSFKYFKALRGLIERLHFVGTARDQAGNAILGLPWLLPGGKGHSETTAREPRISRRHGPCRTGVLPTPISPRGEDSRSGNS